MTTSGLHSGAQRPEANTQFGAARFLAGALLAAALAACGGGAPTFRSQQWHGMDVSLESRPNPPRAGMNEFLVMITDTRGRPAYNLIVSLRTRASDPWVQAIEDGQMGVYRRAVSIDPGADAVLQVQLQSQGATDVLTFPLSQ